MSASDSWDAVPADEDDDRIADLVFGESPPQQRRQLPRSPPQPSNTSASNSPSLSPDLSPQQRSRRSPGNAYVANDRHSVRLPPMKLPPPRSSLAPPAAADREQSLPPPLHHAQPGTRARPGVVAVASPSQSSAGSPQVAAEDQQDGAAATISNPRRFLVVLVGLPTGALAALLLSYAYSPENSAPYVRATLKTSILVLVVHIQLCMWRMLLPAQLAPRVWILLDGVLSAVLAGARFAEVTTQGVFPVDWPRPASHSSVHKVLHVLATVLVTSLLFVLVPFLYRLRKPIVSTRPPDNSQMTVTAYLTVGLGSAAVLLPVAGIPLYSWPAAAAALGLLLVWTAQVRADRDRSLFHLQAYMLALCVLTLAYYGIGALWLFAFNALAVDSALYALALAVPYLLSSVLLEAVLRTVVRHAAVGDLTTAPLPLAVPARALEAAFNMAIFLAFPPFSPSQLIFFAFSLIRIFLVDGPPADALARTLKLVSVTDDLQLFADETERAWSYQSLSMTTTTTASVFFFFLLVIDSIVTYGRPWLGQSDSVMLLIFSVALTWVLILCVHTLTARRLKRSRHARVRAFLARRASERTSTDAGPGGVRRSSPPLPEADTDGETAADEYFADGPRPPFLSLSWADFRHQQEPLWREHTSFIVLALCLAMLAAGDHLYNVRATEEPRIDLDALLSGS